MLKRQDTLGCIACITYQFAGIALSVTDRQSAHELSTKLLFNDLSTRHPGVTSGVSSSYAEAARVCLDRHHTSQAEFQLKDSGQIERAIAEWETADPRTKRAWANRDDATRDGAYGLALAAVEITRGLVAISRAETRTGADYYLGVPDAEIDDLETSIRLEVSGTDEGGESAINSRLKQKLEQANHGCSNLPAMASVVGFKALQIVSEDAKEP